jgi:hypothetical protein
MYYKIENKDCEVYKKLHDLRSKENLMQKENEESICKKVGLEYQKFYGYSGQQQFTRVTTYKGFQFKEPEKIDPKIWKQSKERSDIFVPNKKTKDGKEMSEFLFHLQKSCVYDVFDLLELPHLGRFTFPYLEISNGLIILYLDDKHEPVDENIIEITKKEFDVLLSVA